MRPHSAEEGPTPGWLDLLLEEASRPEGSYRTFRGRVRQHAIRHGLVVHGGTVIPSTDPPLEAHRVVRLNPIGIDNAKIGGPNTYRPIAGERHTCPRSCEFRANGEPFCYAAHGHLAAIAGRAVDDPQVNVDTAALAMVWAAAWGRVARLHTSGDLMRDGELDMAYLTGLWRTASVLRHRLAVLGWWRKRVLGGTEMGRVPRTIPLAFSYEHLAGLDRFEFEMWRPRLQKAGVTFRASARFGEGGAVVVPFDRVNQVRKDTGLPLFKCPAQCAPDHRVSCQDCRLCWTRLDLIPVFKPHGGHLAQVTEAAERMAPAR